MNKNAKKINYTAPAVKVVAFKVERGLDTYSKYVGDQVSRRGTEQLEGSESSWTGTIF